MPTPDISDAFDRAIAGRHLLDHPYYRRWQEGLLTMEDLGAYAGQYRHVERALPSVLAAIAERLGEGPARQLVEENLRDERSVPRPHVELFEGFASAVGAADGAEPTGATQALVGLYERAVSAGPVQALAVVGAYELQAATVAATKAESLRSHYGLGAEGTEFWDVHAELEQAHEAWTVEALRALGASSTVVHELATLSAEAWWSFLDERNIAACEPACV